MKVGIVGGGAIGLLIATYLTKYDHDVTIIVRREAQKQLIKNEGIHRITSHDDKKSSYEKVTAVTLSESDNEYYDLLIVTVKQYQLQSVLQTIDNKNIKIHYALFLQNGMSHVPLLRQVKCESVIVGIVEHGARRLTDNTVIHTGLGKIRTASYSGSVTEVRRLTSALSAEHFPFFYEEEWYKLLAEKLIINSVINPLTTLYQVTNGKLLNNAHFLRNMERLCQESVDVLGLNNNDEMLAKVKKICYKTATNRSSMLVDFESGRETELEAICGYILEQAKQKEISVPHTSFVYESLLGILDIRKGETNL
jgi:2-dehydropantoate 2-reductase